MQVSEKKKSKLRKLIDEKGQTLHSLWDRNTLVYLSQCPPVLMAWVRNEQEAGRKSMSLVREYLWIIGYGLIPTIHSNTVSLYVSCQWIVIAYALVSAWDSGGWHCKPLHNNGHHARPACRHKSKVESDISGVEAVRFSVGISPPPTATRGPVNSTRQLTGFFISLLLEILHLQSLVYCIAMSLAFTQSTSVNVVLQSH